MSIKLIECEPGNVPEGHVGVTVNNEGREVVFDAGDYMDFDVHLDAILEALVGNYGDRGWTAEAWLVFEDDSTSHLADLWSADQGEPKPAWAYRR